MVKIHQTDDGGPFFPVIHIFYGDAVLEIVHEHPIFLHQGAVLKVLEPHQGFVDGVEGQPLVDPHQGILELAQKNGTGIIRPSHIRGVDMGIAHIPEQLDDGLFKGIFGKERGHKITSQKFILD